MTVPAGTPDLILRRADPLGLQCAQPLVFVVRHLSSFAIASLNRDGSGEIARLVHVIPLDLGHIHGEQPQIVLQGKNQYQDTGSLSKAS